MANPRDNVNQGSLGVNAALNGELYLNENTGRTHIRLPAGGTGGGITSYADVPATEEQHVAFLKTLADQKHAEGDNLQQQHEEAHSALQEKQAAEQDGKPVTDVNNPIGAETYGRPPQHVDASLDSRPGPHNPADGRDPIDDQPKSAPVKDVVEHV